MISATIVRRVMLSMGLLVGLVTTSGCGRSVGGGADGDEAIVKGTVTIHGKKATKGVITFDASNSDDKHGGLITAHINKDGTYTIKTHPGQNYVVFSLPVAARDKSLNYQRISKQITPGDNHLDFSLPASM